MLESHRYGGWRRCRGSGEQSCASHPESSPLSGAPSDSDRFQGRCAPAVVIAVTLGLRCLRVDFPVAEAECAAMYHETFWGLVTGDGKEGRG